MNKELKTLDGWDEFTDKTGKYIIHDYLAVGDYVEEAMVEYFMNILSPISRDYGYFELVKHFCNTNTGRYLINY